MIFASMLDDLNNTSNKIKKINQIDYNLWRSGYLFDAIKGLRFGQSFCNHFEIKDNILFYDDRAESCHRYICKNYIDTK